MNIRFALAVASVFLLLSTGCGSSEESRAAAYADPDNEFGGSAVRRERQLHGTWYRGTEGDFLAMELMPDGRAIVHQEVPTALGRTETVTVTYSLLDGGRLSFETRGGATQLYEVSMDRGWLEIRGAMRAHDLGLQRFRKLPDGMTVDQAVAEERAERERAHIARVGALESLLAQPDLVLVVDGPGTGSLSTIAILPHANASAQDAVFERFPYRGVHDEPSPRSTGMALEIEDQRATHRLRLAVTIGEQRFPRSIAPTPEQQTIYLDATGRPAELQVSGEIRMRDGTSRRLRLKVDPVEHARMRSRYDEAVAEFARAEQRVAAPLKDYAVLHGSSEQTTERIIMVRAEDSYEWSGEISVTDDSRGSTRVLPFREAFVEVLQGRPSLVIPGPNRIYALAQAEESGEFRGHWHQRVGAAGTPVTMQVSEALSRNEFNARSTRHREVLLGLDGRTPLVGFVPVEANNPRDPVRLSIAVDGDGAASGTVSFESRAATVGIEGQLRESISGPYLDLRHTTDISTESGGFGTRNTIAMLTRNLGLQLRVDTDESGFPVRLTGRSGGDAWLERGDAEWIAGQRARLAELFGDGVEIQVNRPSIPARGIGRFHLSLDTASGRLSGEFVDGWLEQLRPRSPVRGELLDRNGWPLVRMTATPPPGFRGRYEVGFEFRLFENDGRRLLIGPMLIGVSRIVEMEPTAPD